MLRAQRFSVAGAVTVLLLLLAWVPAEAQLQPASANVTRAVGRVEVLRAGQAQWAPVGVGARLAEGDQIRALAGGSADLTLPDASTIFIAENTRFVVTKLQYNARTRERLARFHLVAGKIRANVTRVAVQLVRARQSNFIISNPEGVAAIRGTVTHVFYNPATRQAVVLVLPSPGEPPALAQVSYVNLVTGQSVTVGANQIVVQTAAAMTAPVSFSALSPQAQTDVLSATNTATAGAPQLTAPTVTIVTEAQIAALLAAAGITPAGPTVTGETNNKPPSTLGRDQQTCPSPPCQ